MPTAETSDRVVSFIVRSYTEAAFIGRLLQTLQDQKDISLEQEIVVVDSELTDDTVRIARQWPVKLVQIRKREFHYSRALNLGIAESRGELIVILSAHSIPASATWLSQMLGHFRDQKIAAVYCRQIPWPDANWREVRRINQTFGT